MKIGINARFLMHPYTGIGRYTRQLVSALAKQDSLDEYFLFVPEPVDLNLPENFHVVRVAEKESSSASLRKEHWEHTLLPQEMEKIGIQLAHFLYPSNPWKKLPFPTVVTVHDVIPWALPEYRSRLRSKAYHFYAKQALKKADHFITVSEFTKTELLKLISIPEKNISVIPLAAPEIDAGLAEIPSLDLRRKYFLYVGGYDERKNVPALMEAFQKHMAPHYPVDLLLVGAEGKGLERFLTDEYCELVGGHRMRPKGRVVFTDTFSDAELRTLYRQAFAFVNVSKYEGFNLPLIEAMQEGTPVITSDLKVHHEVTGDAALFVHGFSADAIGVGLHQIYHDQALQKDLAERGRKRAQDFSWKTVAEDTAGVYHLFG
jgi:glycosyltransferase involved in cell wall biosynthesis